MDKQIVFNTVVNHLRTQGKRAAPAEGGCFYRVVTKGEILKCAVGCLIPDNLYLPMMENCTVWADPTCDSNTNTAGKRGALLRAALAFSIENFNPDPCGPDVAFLRELQVIHDGSNNSLFWEEGFVMVARHHNLTVPPKE